MIVFLLLSCASRTVPPVPSAPQPAAAPQLVAAPTPPVSATLAAGEGGWTLTYRFATPAQAWMFEPLSTSRTVAGWGTDDAELVEIEGLDYLFMDPPRTEVVVAIGTPEVVSSGLPVLPYSDGSLLVSAGSLGLMTIEGREAAEALEGRLSRWKGEQIDVPLTVVRPDSEEALVVRRGSGPWIHPREVLGTSTMDPTLPPFMTAAVADLAAAEPLIEAWFPTADPWPAVTHLGWKLDPDAPGGNLGFANVGAIAGFATIPDTEPNASRLQSLRWFFVHERVHNHQLAAEVSVRGWPLEGMADFVATAALYQTGHVDEAWVRETFQQVEADCAAEMERGPIAGAPGRVQYVCGDLLVAATRAVVVDFPEFWERLVSSAAKDGASIDGSYYRYLLGGYLTPEQKERFESVTTQASSDPKKDLHDFLMFTGVLDAEGVFDIGLLSPRP